MFRLNFAPLAACQFVPDEQRLPRFPNESRARLHHDGMAVAAVVVRLPLEERLRAGSASASLSMGRFVGMGYSPYGINPAVQVRLIGIIEKIDGHQRLAVRHEHIIHFLKQFQSAGAIDPRFDMICAIIASEFASTGRLEMHSFHGFVTGKICMADTTASALVVLNKMEFVTTGSGPRMRPSWLIRAATAGVRKPGAHQQTQDGHQELHKHMEQFITGRRKGKMEAEDGGRRSFLHVAPTFMPAGSGAFPPSRRAKAPLRRGRFSQSPVKECVNMRPARLFFPVPRRLSWVLLQRAG